jgi:glycosyltransferase involved in cell wall biosynthesis
MNQIRITFVIPYYRNLQYLSLAINSILNQENPAWNAIVLDDCGGEDAEELVLSFEDERITYIRNENNLGLAKNWNKGLRLAKTEFVTLLHSDDLLISNYVEVMQNLMDENPHATVGHCRAMIVDKNGRKCWSFPDEFKKIIRPRDKNFITSVGDSGLASLLNGSWIFCPTLCYRKELIHDYEFDSQWKFVVDVEYMSQILFNGGALVGSPITAYEYRRHDENQTAVLTRSLHRFQEEIDFLKFVENEGSSD